ncbi:response regulator [Bacteriovoracales bacterium]|nr:response regulator [Bacteriovoracales bacterium]
MAKKILLIDDSEMVLQILGAMIEDVGYELETASDGMQGLEELGENDYDCLITDLNMPVMDGYTFIKKVREIEKYSDTPIIIVTTEKEASDKERGFEVGADIYLVKPVQKEELQEKLKMLLDES